MTFLNPAILFGLLAASVPIVLHFMNLRKLKKIEFSTLNFLKELQKTKIRRIKLKQWLLLLLRIFIIVFVVLGFARPALTGSDSGTSSAATSAVFIIDNTFSMSAVVNEGSYFNKAKQAALKLIGGFKIGDDIAVIPLVSEKDLSIAPKTNLELVKREIEEIRILDTRGTLNEAIIKAGRILYDSQNINKEIYIFTDLQKGSLFRSENDISYLPQLLNGSRIFIIDSGNRSLINIGVDEIKSGSQIFEKNKKIGFYSTITNYSDEKVDRVASLFINGKRSAQQSVSLTAGESKEFYFETTLSDTGVITASVELEDDDINRDNKRFLNFFVPDKIKVLFLYKDPGDARFVRLALSSQSSSSLQITEAGIGNLSAYQLNNFDAVIIIGSVDGEPVNLINNYITEGGGILLFPGSGETIASIQTFFKKLNIPAPESFVGRINSEELISRFDRVDLNHPIFADLFEESANTRIESPLLYYYIKLNPGRGINIISMLDRSSFMSEHSSGRGKILLYNISPVLSWSNFPLKSIFPTLITKSVMYLSSGFKGDNRVLAGEELPVNIKGASSNQIKVIKPDGLIEFINTDSISGRNYFRYLKTDLTGTYIFYSGNKLLDHFSVNHDPMESRVEYSSISDLNEYLRKTGYDFNATSLSGKGDIIEQVNSARFGDELWKYFIIGALLLALIEMFVARSTKKEMISMS